MEHSVRVTFDYLPAEAKDIVSQIPAWSADSQTSVNMLERALYYSVSGDAIPVLKGGSDTMLFPKRLTLIVLPDYSGFSDSGFLVPAATTRNIVLTGLQDVRARLRQAGLSRQVKVRYIAEELDSAGPVLCTFRLAASRCICNAYCCVCLNRYGACDGPRCAARKTRLSAHAQR